MTTCSFPLPKTSQLQAVEQSETSDCLAGCARFTKRATCTTRPQRDGSSERKIRCPMRTCDADDQVHHAHLSNTATQIASCGSDKEGRVTRRPARMMEPNTCSTRACKREIRTLRQTRRTRREFEQHMRTCIVRLLAPPQPSTRPPQ